MCGLVYTYRNASPRKGGCTNSEIVVCAIQSKPIEDYFCLSVCKMNSNVVSAMENPIEDARERN